ncbi:hypothetical protein [Streptomyces resistomycificus]|uniref:hypothetical protein n=1 Tax=Streptomyces resistomycificus TaxID=67356 RepID=UPI000AB3FFB5|nr:hypothetical protein [Streptomyces resistomycificus]
MTTSFARPAPPYYAVIITARPAADLEGYAAMSERMAALGEAQPGYLGRESLTDERQAGTSPSSTTRTRRR